MKVLEIVIAHAPNGDDEEIALAYARRLFAVLDEAIGSLLLVPTGNDLVVSLNGRVVYAASQVQRPPRLADVTDALRSGPEGS